MSPNAAKAMPTMGTPCLHKRPNKEGYCRVGKLFRAAAQAEAIHRELHKSAITSLGGRPDEIKLVDVKVARLKKAARRLYLARDSGVARQTLATLPVSRRRERDAGLLFSLVLTAMASLSSRSAGRRTRSS
jgi:hypothetical protein